MTPRPGPQRCGRCGVLGHNSRTHEPGNGRRSDARSWSEKTPSATKAASLWRDYRLPFADFLRMLEGGCAVCGQPFERTPDVDHQHGCAHPGKGSYSCRACVRGLLCRSCNLAVGAFERGQNSEDRIAAYLGRPRAVPAAEQLTLF